MELGIATGRLLDRYSPTQKNKDERFCNSSIHFAIGLAADRLVGLPIC
jgi:hypothetical protein